MQEIVHRSKINVLFLWNLIATNRTDKYRCMQKIKTNGLILSADVSHNRCLTDFENTVR